MSFLLSIVIASAIASKADAASATLTWDANTEADLAGYKVYVGTSPRIYGAPIVIGNQTSHTLTSLSTGIYYFAVTAIDTSGNESAFSVEVSKNFSGNTAPVISGVTVSGISSNGATMNWITNEPASSQVDYGLTPNYGSVSALNTTRVTQHSRTLSGLSPGTTYHYRVVSTNAAGLTGTSGNFSFTTVSAPDTTPPALSAIASSGITNTQALITWTTNEAATSQVDYGLTASFGTVSALNTTRVTQHSRTLSGLSPGTTYHYRVISTDAAGNTATSGHFTFTTPSAPDTTPPILGDITASGVNGGTQALITWVSNELATSQVRYGLTASYGNLSAFNNTLVTNHSRTLFGLTPETTYHYQVVSTDAEGNTTSSGDHSFVTPAQSQTDTTPPLLSNIGVTLLSSTEVTINWNTNEAANARVEYGTSPAYGNNSPVNTTPATLHTMVLFGLTPATLYHYRVISNDAAGNVAVSSDFTFTTKTAVSTSGPKISSVAVTQITHNSATILWGTDKPATSQIAYGPTTSYGHASIQNQSLSNSHAQKLDFLEANTLYHFQVVSADEQGNTTISSGHTFTTGVQAIPPPSSEALNLTATAGLRNITLNWTNPSDPDFTGVLVYFRTDRPLTDFNDGTFLGDFTGNPNQAMSTIHIGLEDGTLYYYTATAYDRSARLRNTGSASATTLQANSNKSESVSAGGGCGMIFPTDGNPPGPGQSAGMIGLFGIVLLLIIKKEMKRFRFERRNNIILHWGTIGIDHRP